jgi:hypothetical protein
MRDKEWKDYFRRSRAEAQAELEGFKEAIAKYRLRIIHRDIRGEKDLTDESLRDLEQQVAECQRMLEDD